MSATTNGNSPTKSGNSQSKFIGWLWFGLVLIIIIPLINMGISEIKEKVTEKRQREQSHAQKSSNNYHNKSVSYNLKMGQVVTVIIDDCYTDIKLYPKGKKFYYQEPGGSKQLVGGDLPVYQTAGVSEFYMSPFNENITVVVKFKK